MRAWFFILFLSSISAHAGWQAKIHTLVQRGGVYVESASGTTLFALSPDTPFIPASTLKIATASAAIDLLGEDYRFATDFYMDDFHNLWIKGYGDPLLVSEELARIAAALKEKGVTHVAHLYLDDSFFSDIVIPGASQSLNPYDAKNGALLANFNTLNIVKHRNGNILSAEPQTPLTLLTRELAARAPVGKSRINLAAYPGKTLLYVGHLMQAFLAEVGIPVSGSIEARPVPGALAPFYHHLSSQPLTEVLRGLLAFSTNFTANQVYLHLGANVAGAPATLTKSNDMMQAYLQERIGLEQAVVEEGSGLSRHNAFSAREMVKLLRHFEPHYTLLKPHNGHWAKTGTLTGVSCLAGYFSSRSHGLVRFAILLNQGNPRGGNHRDTIARLLEQGLQ